MSLKLALNATALLSPLTGIGQYVLNLAKELIKSGTIDLDFFYALYWQKTILDSPVAYSNQLRSSIRDYVPCSYELSRFLQKLRFTQHTKNNKFDLYHEPNYLLMPFDGPSVVTVHDLSWIHYPELHPVNRVRALNKYFEKSLENANYILTDSEYVRQEIIQLLSVKPDKVQAIHLGVDALFQPHTEEDVKAILQKYGLIYNRYLLAVGTLEPRKNLNFALQAYQQLPSDLRKIFPLIIIGMRGWKLSELDYSLQRSINREEIKLLGYIPRTDLAAITAGATTLIYPSIYEGFGLPPLEAMACGVPPIISAVSSLPEVVRDGGVTIAPTDQQALTNAINRLIDDPAYRKKLGRQALKLAQPMTWQFCAAQTYQAYQKTLSLY
ncbi:alpha-1,3-rhamnosyl/mannosyltransferase [Thiothrix eikelboomii]|uniref:Alpha-1,3-rhamnosyl/mannosyltransferase n=1 Tax=Thiothrix eikelboomii TaxID=92487 RepID=A0A1T4XKI3_9GAMM|nr:glycosyltransferase family 1 protein [Thiothrix eikelboomii]SKA90072.1 alpha-1,3-rhamnosyl/mannosyltransferase [Thiothrix eikelboomii]